MRFAVVVVLLAASASAQPRGGPTRVDGAPHRTATALALDADGALWVGTPLGLVRYDGHRFRPVLSGRPYVNAGALALGPGGSVWAGTKDALCRATAAGARCWRLAPGGSADVRAVGVGPAGDVWAGTETGLIRLAGGAADTATSAPVRALRIGPRGALVGTVDGLWAGPRPGALRRVAGPLARAYVTAFETGPDGALYVGTFGEGVFRVPPGRPASEAAPVASDAPALRVIALRHDPHDGTLWVGTWGQGAYVLDAGSDGQRLRAARADEAPDEPAVAAVAPAGWGGRWIGTWGGLYHVPAPPPYRWLGRDAGLPSASVDAIAGAPDGALWAADARGGLWRCVGERCTGVALPAGGVEASDLTVDEAGAVWAATFGGGVWRVAPGPPRRAGPADLMAYTVRRAGDSLWVGTLNRGVLAARVPPGGVPDSLAPRLADDAGPVFGIVAGPRGLTAVATQARGGCRVRGARLDCPGPAVLALDALSAGGDVWVATVDGLTRLGRGAVPLGLRPRPDVSCLVDDGAGGLWAATGTGLLRLDTRTARVTLDGVAAGLPSTAFDTGACTRLPDGAGRGPRLAFGHRDGVLIVDPAALPPPDRRLAVTGVTVDGRPRRASAALTLGPADGGPTFEFASPLTAPGTAPVAYRLVGLDDRWTLADGGRAVFGRLPAGRYTFEVRSAHAAAALPVRVLAPVWRRPWALALGALAALGLAAAAYRVRVGVLLREAQTRRQIADDLHDEMGSRLGALATTLDLAALRVPPDARPAVAAHADDARALLGDLRDTVWAVDAGHATLADLGARIRQTAEDLLPDVELAVDVAGRGVLTMRERRHVLYVAKEALHNAARHARPAAVSVRLALGADGLRLTVADDGAGLAPGRPAGRGLASMQRRAEALGGTLAVDAAPGGGTRVALHVPRRLPPSREAPAAPAP